MIPITHVIYRGSCNIEMYDIRNQTIMVSHFKQFLRTFGRHE